MAIDYASDPAPYVVAREDVEPAPQRYYRKLLDECEEHQHLKDGEARVAFLLARDPVVEQQRAILGRVHLPGVQGKLRDVFIWMLEREFRVLPDYLVTLDKDFWLGADDIDREILVYHEMCHMVQAVDKWGTPRYHRETGDPVWALVGHDVEEFTAVVRRYGAHNTSIQAFVEAAFSAL